MAWSHPSVTPSVKESWPDRRSPQGLASGHVCTPPLQAYEHAPTLGLPAAGDQKSGASQKPRSRGILHSLFCCVCQEDGEALPTHSGAPLLVEENGAVPKVGSDQMGAVGSPGFSPEGL